jgi:hypothetical protein
MGSLLRNFTRIGIIKSCIITFDQLYELFTELEKKIIEAMEYQKINTVNSFPDMPEEKFKKLIEDNFKLTINFQTQNGESISMYDKSELKENIIPDEVEQILIESSFLYRNTFNYDPLNRIELLLDLKKTDIGDMSNLVNIIPVSNFRVIGNNKTWVDGVFKYLDDYFNKKAASRNIFYKKFTYDFILYFLQLPVIFWLIYKLDKYILSKQFIASKVFLIFLYIFVILMILYTNRIIFNYLKRLYPYIELELSNSKLSKIRIGVPVILLGALSSLFATMIYEILKFIFL